MDSTEYKSFIIHTDFCGERFVDINGQLISVKMIEMFYKNWKEKENEKNFSSSGYAK